MSDAAQTEERTANSGILSRLRSCCIFVPLIYLYTAIMGSLSLLSSFFDRDGRMQHWFARTWSRMILKTAFIHVKVEGLEHIDPSQAAVYASNHLSALDIPVLYASLPTQFRILAKSELFRYPFMGWHLTRSGQIPIDHDDARASLRSLNRASESLRKGMPLVIFPEGGRSRDGRLQDFMGGAFYMAIKAQAPVVPIVLIGTYELLPMNSFHLHPGRVDMIIGEPISTKGMVPRQMDKLAARVREVMADMYCSRAKVSVPELVAGIDASGSVVS
jgi:1-acyl-sn-glycerol-3-phosphate acyltransferase